MTNRRAFQGLADELSIGDSLLADSRDEGTQLRDDLDQAVVAQARQGLPNRRPADAHLSGQRVLGELGAREQVPAYDRAAQRRVHLQPAGAPATRRTTPSRLTSPTGLVYKYSDEPASGDHRRLRPCRIPVQQLVRAPAPDPGRPRTGRPSSASRWRGLLIGLLLAQPVVGAVSARRGSYVILAAAPLYLAAVVLPALAFNGLTLFLAVAVTGGANGVLDVSMNAQGIAVERATGLRIFNSLHAVWALGALGGAALAAVAIAAGVSPVAHLAVIAVAGSIAAYASPDA